MADVNANVLEMYVAFFGRPAEPAGADFWDTFVSDALAEGRNVDAVEQEIAARFADADEAQGLYAFLQDPASGNVTQFVNGVYGNLFNRDAETEGLEFWQGRFQEMLDGGMPIEQAASKFVIEILNAAQNEDAAAVQNKVQVAKEYSDRFLETGATFTNADDLQAAQDLIASVASGETSLEEARTQLDAILDANTTSSGVVTDGYVSGATVWADQDGDGVQDPDEPTTTTDENGNFTFTDEDGNEIEVGGSLVARGGTDITTGLPFQGTLNAPENSSTVSPLTSLVSRVQQETGGSSEDAEAQVKRALGLSEDVDLNTYDPIAVLSDDDASDEDKAAALQVQSATVQVVNLTSLAGSASGGATGNDDTGASNDDALDAIADAISRAGEGETVDLADGETVGNIVRDALMRAQQSSGQSLDDDQVDNIVDNVSELARNANERVREASEDGDAGAGFEQMTRVQKVAQGDGAHSVRQGAQNNNFDETNEQFGGDNLNDRAQEQEVDLPDVIDDTPADPPAGGGGGGGGGAGPTPQEQFIAEWQELDAIYVAISDADNATPNGAADGLTNELAVMGDYGDPTAYDGPSVGGEDTLGEAAQAVNTAFVELANEYVEYLENGGEPLDDEIAKERSESDPGQSYHDNILGNVRDGVITGRFENVSQPGDEFSDTPATGNTDLTDPRDSDAQEYGSRPYYSGFASAAEELAETIGWDLAKGIDRSQELANGEIVLVSASPDGESLEGAERYTDLGTAVGASDGGDYLFLGGGSYDFSSRLDLPDNLTFIGAGDDSTTLNQTGDITWGLYAQGGDTASDGSHDGLHLEGFAIQGDTDRHIKIAYGSNVTIQDVTAVDANVAEIDVNNVTNLSMSDVTADGDSTPGNGLALSGVAGAQLDGITTTGNNWGGIGLFDASNSVFDGPPSGFTAIRSTTQVDLVNSDLQEDVPVYVDGHYSPKEDIDELNLEGFNYGIENPDHRDATSSPDDHRGEDFIYFQRTLEDAIDYAVAIQAGEDDPEPSSFVYELDRDPSTGHLTCGDTLYVGDGMSIQAAIDASSDGDTIVVGEGTYAGDLTITKDITLQGANHGASADGSRDPESVINGNIEVTTDGATVDGFQIDGVFTGGASQFIDVDANDMTFANNIVSIDGGNGGVSAAFAGTNNTIEDNSFAFEGTLENRGDVFLAIGAGSNGTLVADNAISGGRFNAAFAANDVVTLEDNEIDFIEAGDPYSTGGTFPGDFIFTSGDMTGSLDGVETTLAGGSKPFDPADDNLQYEVETSSNTWYFTDESDVVSFVGTGPGTVNDLGEIA